MTEEAKNEILQHPKGLKQLLKKYDEGDQEARKSIVDLWIRQANINLQLSREEIQQQNSPFRCIIPDEIIISSLLDDQADNDILRSLEYTSKFLRTSLAQVCLAIATLFYQTDYIVIGIAEA